MFMTQQRVTILLYQLLSNSTPVILIDIQLLQSVCLSERQLQYYCQYYKSPIRYVIQYRLL